MKKREPILKVNVLASVAFVSARVPYSCPVCDPFYERHSSIHVADQKDRSSWEENVKLGMENTQRTLARAMLTPPHPIIRCEYNKLKHTQIFYHFR